jgi:hypothetical protein
MKDVTSANIIAVVEDAKKYARANAQKYFYEKLGGVDQYACGFAWVDIYGVRSNSVAGKALIAAGFRKSYTKSLQLWNPADMAVQNIDTLEAGAEAFKEFFKMKFPEAVVYTGSRLD